MQAFDEKKCILYIKTRNYIYVDTKTKNHKNYLLKNNLNNFRANQKHPKKQAFSGTPHLLARQGKQHIVSTGI